MTNCQLKTLWKFLSSANMTLQACKYSGLHLQQTNDICLMDYLVSVSLYASFSTVPQLLLPPDAMLLPC